MKKLLLVFGLIIFTASIAENFAQEIKQVEIAGTQLLTVHSSIVNQDYNLYINIPRFFDDTTKTFPVIYLLDAQWDFPLLNAIYGEQYYDGFLPEAIIVGITWGGVNPNPDILRRRDFTPTPEGNQPVGGGASKFLSFIKKELIPFIDSKFRTNPNDRTLMGSSLGGLFTTYALFNETELFNRYALTSPAIGWNSGVISSYEDKYSKEGSEIPVKVSMAIGGYEDVASFQKFVENLKEKNYPGLKLKTFVLEGIGHSGGKAEGYTRGLQYVFEKEPVIFDDDILEQYTGTYQVNPQFKVELSKENGYLIGTAPGMGKLILYAESENEFYVKGQYLRLHFKRDDEGNVNGFESEQYDGKQFLKKVN